MNKIFIASPLLLSTLPFLAIAEETVKLSPVTVTSTRSEHNSRLTSNTVISREDIERKQIRTIEDALRGVAGINIANSGGLGKQTSIYLRGTESDHILILIDGIRAGSATTGAAAWQHIPISEIESIEVVRGPKSSLYGADAIGGVIHIHTRSAASSESKLSPVLSVGGGTYGHYKVQAGVSGKVGKAWYNFNTSHEKAEGFNAREDLYEPDRDGYENYATTARLGYKLTDWLSMEGNIMYSAGTNSYDGNFDAFGAPSTGGQPDYKNEFTQLVYGGKATIQAMDFWRIELAAGESRDESANYLDNVDGGIYDTHRVSFSGINSFTLTPEHVFSLGYDFLNDSIESTDDYTETSRNNHAAFIQYQGEFAQNQIQFAYRSDHNEQFGQHSTWNAAWGYAFKNGILVSASYGTGFKAPTFNDLFYPGFGNSKLNPENSESYEVGVSGEHENWNWSLNGYLTNLDNMLAYDEVTFSAYNLNAQIMGLEAVVGGRIYDFDVQLNYNALDPKSKDVATEGNILARRAQQMFRVDIDRKIGNASLGTTVNFEGRRFDDLNNTREIDAFVTWDLRAEYQFYEQLTLQGAVKNILNTQYQTASGYNSAGVTVFFNMRYAPQL